MSVGLNVAVKNGEPTGRADLVSTSEVPHLALKYENAEEVGISGTRFI